MSEGGGIVATSAYRDVVLKAHEGYSEKPYRDCMGNWTIGWGTLIEWPALCSVLGLRSGWIRISREIAEGMFDYGVWRAEETVTRYIGGAVWGPRRDALVMMAYQLGNDLHDFVNMREAVRNKRWAEAKAHALDSKWARQMAEAGSPRAEEVSEILRTGIYPTWVVDKVKAGQGEKE